MKKALRPQSSFTLHASYKYQVHTYMHRVHSCTRRRGENFMHASRAVPSSTAHVLSSHVPVGNNEQELEISFHNVETRTFAFTERRCSRNVEHENGNVGYVSVPRLLSSCPITYYSRCKSDTYVIRNRRAGKEKTRARRWKGEEACDAGDPHGC